MKFLITLLAAITVLTASAGAVTISPNCGAGSAAGTPQICGPISGAGNPSNPAIDLIKTAIDIISYVIGITAVIIIIVGGLRMVVSNGDAQAAASARTSIIYAAIGLAVVALSQIIVVFVLDKVK